MPVLPKKTRNSVSAECFGSWNKREEFKAPVVPKTEEAKERLKGILMQAFMFEALNP